MADPKPQKSLNQSDFAKRRGVNRATVNKWKAKGLIVFDAGGLIDVEQTEWNLDQRPPTYRGGVAHRPVRQATKAKAPASAPNGAPARRDLPAAAPPVPSDGDDGAHVDPAGPNLPMAEAVRRKENYLGLQRKHDFEVAQNEWVRVEDVGKLVETEYANIREKLLIMPGKLASHLVGLDRAAIEIRLHREVTEALNELHDPERIVEHISARDEVAESAEDSQASAHPKPD